ncbi:meiosis-specific with OB domain-containing protein-like [Centruroides sculpturatus]|uniref:meiosis-specific with OB domain-containing protein-like n=1 Tax=Centruroides sculpturatus TaxID=218467 RepID=UPI000C6EEA1C|nr:meiosis-specific with OB domain-containing protein-like [Centruroides sculpturatus]
MTTLQNKSVLLNENKTVQICDLSPNLFNAIIVGIVITKQDVKNVQSKRKPGTERYVLGFTLRDSPNDTINITCWGDEHDVNNISNQFQIMDVVKIKNPQIQLKHSASSDNRYRPEVSSPFHLNISAKYSEVNICFEAQEKYDCLIHIPTKFNQYYNLVDIINNGQNIDGKHVNLLVGLKSVSGFFLFLYILLLSSSSSS